MTEARTIYAVTKGCYSEYGIIGIFLDKARAEKCVELINGGTYHGDDAEIEEYEDGNWADMTKVLKPVYIAAISLETGADLAERTEADLAFVTDRIPRFGSTSVITANWMCNKITEFHAIGRSYVSQAHAHKLAVEARQRWLAEKAGV